MLLSDLHMLQSQEFNAITELESGLSDGLDLFLEVGDDVFGVEVSLHVTAEGT